MSRAEAIRRVKTAMERNGATADDIRREVDRLHKASREAVIFAVLLVVVKPCLLISRVGQIDAL